jgi:hypothetical protein
MLDHTAFSYVGTNRATEAAEDALHRVAAHSDAERLMARGASMTRDELVTFMSAALAAAS